MKPTVLSSIINNRLGLSDFMIPKLRQNFELIPRDVYEKDPEKFKNIQAVLIRVLKMAQKWNSFFNIINIFEKNISKDSQ